MKTENGSRNELISTAEIEYLVGIVVKAMTYAETDPETSLMHARKCAEAICTKVFSNEIGNPGNSRLDKLIEQLVRQDKLPERIKIPLRVIQQYGNYAAHVQPEKEYINRQYIEPCLTALVHVTNWYFHDYLQMVIPAAIARTNNEYDPQPDKSAGIETYDEATTGDLGLPHALRAYQWKGVSFLARQDAALLADEMGLGKTVQAIIALRLVLRASVSKRALIVCPASLALNWERELNTWASNLAVRRVMGTAADRAATYQLPIQVLIATYEQIRSDGISMPSDISFEVVVLDEAQRIKNRNSRSALACRLVRRERSWCLSGTPLENSIDDLASIFLFLSPGLVDVGMPPREIHSRIQDHFVRRRKSEVLPELPPIMVQDLLLELSGSQEAAYTDLWISRRDNTRQSGVPVSEVTLFALITKLKQMCNYEPRSEESVKWETLSVFLEDLVGVDDKVVIFSQYVDTLEFLSRKMGSFPHDIYSGQQTQQEKDQTLKHFRATPGPRALLMSLRAGGVGLNIQEASTVILFDRWWNPAVEDQAIQRAHRFGRNRPLHVIRFLVVRTIEERINRVLKGKREEFEAYIEDAQNAPVKLFTRVELRRILALSSVDIDENCF